MEILHIPKKINNLDIPTNIKVIAYLINKSAYRVPDTITLGSELLMLWQEKESTVGLSVSDDSIQVHTHVDGKESTMTYANTILCEDYNTILNIDDQILPALSGILIPGTWYGALGVQKGLSKDKEFKFDEASTTLEIPSADTSTLSDWFTFTGKF